MRAVLTAATLALTALGGCHHNPTVRPSVVLTTEFHSGVVDVSPPQRLDVLLTPAGDPSARCDDMGGSFATFETGTPNQVAICIGVDY